MEKRDESFTLIEKAHEHSHGHSHHDSSFDVIKSPLKVKLSSVQKDIKNFSKSGSFDPI